MPPQDSSLQPICVCVAFFWALIYLSVMLFHHLSHADGESDPDSPEPAAEEYAAVQRSVHYLNNQGSAAAHRSVHYLNNQEYAAAQRAVDSLNNQEGRWLRACRCGECLLAARRGRAMASE